MRVSVDDIRKKAEELAPGYEKQVNWDGSSHHAEVTSVNAPLEGDAPVYTVSIKPAQTEGFLETVCPCPAAKLCYHLAMFYGVVKGIGTEAAQDTPVPTEQPAKGVEPVPAPKTTPSRAQALQLIAEGMEKVIDGLGQFARSTARQEAKVVVEELMRKLAIAQERGLPGTE